MLKYLFLIFTLIVTGFSLSAQRPEGRGGNVIGQISGKIIDKTSNEPMEYATVTAFHMENMKLISGTISGKNGEFLLDSLKGGIYQLRFSFIGYETLIKDSIKITPASSSIDLGKIVLSNSDQTLDEVDIVSDKPIVKYEIDKKVIDVSNLNTTASESAVEVLENVPSINVDIDGNVSLRGNSSFTLLIDNKPTNLDVTDALKLIPANTIQEIEIITNPSARYDAEGVSGIINIVLKKNKLSGTSALINANVGTYGQLGGNFLINMNKNNVSLTIGGNYRGGEMPRFNDSYRETMLGNILSRIEQNGIASRNFGGYGSDFEFEWRPNRKTTFTAGGKIGMRHYNSSSDLNFKEYADGTLLYEYHNVELATREFLNYAINSTLTYNIAGNKKHYINAKAIYNVHDGEELSITEYFNNEDVIQGGNKNTEVGPSNMARFNIDYVRPIKKENRFETGLQAQIGISGDATVTYTYDTIIGDYSTLTAYNTDVDYYRNIYAAYSIYAGKLNKINYQLGFRGEYTDRTITASSDTLANNIDRFDWFPSAHLSYNSNNKNQFMVNVSRRIQRPRSYYFEPFITWQDAYSVRSGNSRLIPEYILSYELGWIRKLKKGNLSFEIYHRDVTNKIQRVRTVYSENVILSKPENIGKELSTGLEMSYSYPLAKWWRASISGNIYNYLVTGELEDISFSQQSFSYNGRFNNSITIKKIWKLQITGKYNSSIVTPQGTQSDNYSMDASIKRDFNKNKMSLSIQARDVFSTSKTITIIESQNLYTKSIKEPRTPTVNLALSIRLNNYNKKQARPDQSDEF